jgi:RHS repeat-associated protein
MLQRLLTGVLLLLLVAGVEAKQDDKVTVTLAVNTAASVLTAPGTVQLQADAQATQQNHPIVQVEFYNGPTLIGTVTSAPYRFTWNNVAAGTYALTARAVNDKNDVATSAPVSVNVNAAPTVSLTGPANHTVTAAPASFTLTANAADSDGSVTKVDFYQNNQLIGTATSAPYSINWSNVAAGSYSVTAVATDNQGASTTSSPVSLIADAAPMVSLTAPANNSVVTAPASFNLTASAAVSSTGGSIAKVEFYNGAALIGTATTAPYSYTWSNVTAGTYVISAKAYDSYAIAATSAPLTLIANAAPTVSLTAPINNASYTAGGTVMLSANAADSDGSITKVDFYQNNQLIGTATSAPYSYTWSNVGSGSYSLTAVATDNNGATTTSSPVAVAAYNPPTVSLTAPAANTISAAPATFTLSANAGAASGRSLTKVDFYQGSTLIGTATSAPYSFTWSNVAAGSYSITAVATDDRNISTTSNAVTVIANAPPTVSITGPATGSALAAPASFNLTANAADSDGTVTKVDFYDGASLIGSATSAPYSLTWSNVADGMHSVTAIATDNNGATTTSAAVSLIAVTPPTVSLTAPASNSVVTAPASFNLTANAAASATGGTIAKVEFYNGATLIGSATTAPYSFTWSNVVAGTYSITAKAYDSYGIASTSAAVSLVSNAAPTVSLTAPANNAAYTAAGTVTLTATAADSDGSISKVEFYQNNQLIGTATTAPYSFDWSNIIAGSHSLSAIATDNNGATTTSSPVTIGVYNAPTVSLTTPASNSVIAAPATVTITANASADTGRTLSKVDFYQGTVLLGTATAAPYSFTWSNVAAGSYSLTAKATDDLGATTTSAAISFSANAAPTISFSAPANNASYITPATVTLSATAADSDGTIAQVEFYNGSTLLATITTAPYSYDWSNVQPGNYTLFAKATDNNGATMTAAAINISVAANQAPTINITAPSPNTSYTAPASIHLVASAADSDGTVAKVDFYNGNTLLGTTTTAPYSYDWSNVQPGSYSITAMATDDRNASTTSGTLQIMVISGIAQAYYIHTDQLNTPRLITDNTNTPVWRWDSDPFGSTAANEDPNGTGNRFEYNPRFPGQYADKETGLNYNYFRDYDASTGRYIESDPIGLAGGSFSTYAYANQNPLTFTDTFGLETTMVCRPINDKRVSWLGVKHCFVVVWHWENKCGKREKVIDRQYSLAGAQTPFPQNTQPKPGTTFGDDRNAFNNPGGPNEHYPILPPPGMTQDGFDAAVSSSGDGYRSGEPYDAKFGPNSNTAADNIIEGAGGIAPNVPGAVNQNYGEAIDYGIGVGSGMGH